MGQVCVAAAQQRPGGAGGGGATAYSITYLGCVVFYSPFGVEPADVGLGYADVLAQAAAYLALVAFAWLSLGGMIAYGGHTESRHRSPTDRPPRHRLPRGFGIVERAPAWSWAQ